MHSGTRKQHRGRSGHAIIEMALLGPWIFFLFAGVFDAGWFWAAAISVQNAARTAVLRTSASGSRAADNAGACKSVLAELQALPNVRGLTSCDAPPVTVAATYVAGPDGAPASRVAVVYRTDQLIPIPGLSGQATLTGAAQMRIKDPNQ